MKSTILLLFISVCQISNAQSGFLDSSFGDGGKKVIYTGGNCYATSIQEDEKILLAGDGETGNIIIRLLQNGSLDFAFGNNGLISLPFSEYGGGEIRDLQVQSDRKIIAAVILGGPIMLARFKENGTLDSSFGVNGTSTVEFEQHTAVYRMQIQPDGKYVLAGNLTYESLSTDVVVIRFNADGSLDKSFGYNGEVIISQDYASEAYDILLQPDGKIVIGGDAYHLGEYAFFLARLNTDGSLDTSFGNAGTMRNAVVKGDEYINSIVLQPDGKIVAAGLGQILAQGLPEIMTAVRYQKDGSIDKSFGNNGVVTVPFGEYASEAKAVLLQADGKIILAGRVTNDSQSYSDPAICRLKPDGSLDSTFGINGEQITELEGTNGENDATLQPDGKIVLAGGSFIDHKGYYNVLRYNNDKTGNSFFARIRKWLHRHGFTWDDWPFKIRSYTVERSADGIHFNEIARIVNTANQSNLSYEDNAPLSGDNYYRVRAESIDGSVTYSNVIEINENTISIHLYPNPVKDILNIKGLDAGGSYELSVMSAKGNFVAKAAINNTSSYKWNLRNLSKGVYYLHLRSTNDNATTIKIVKQ